MKFRHWTVIGFVVIYLGGISVSLFAQDTKDRTTAAVPTLVEQRNNALDSVALCQGDLSLLKQQLAAANAEIEKLKAPSK